MCLWGALCGAKCPFKDHNSSEKDESLASSCSWLLLKALCMHWGEGNVLKLKSSLVAQIDIILVISSWKSQNLLLFLRCFPEAEQWNNRQQMGQGLPWEQGEGFCRDWKRWYRNALLGYLWCLKSSREVLNEQSYSSLCKGKELKAIAVPKYYWDMFSQGVEYYMEPRSGLASSPYKGWSEAGVSGWCISSQVYFPSQQNNLIWKNILYILHDHFAFMVQSWLFFKFFLTCMLWFFLLQNSSCLAEERQWAVLAQHIPCNAM